MTPIPAAAMLPIIKDFITATGSYLECKEHEKTKRAQISAELEAKLTIINKQYDLCKETMANHHEYAMKAYDSAEQLLKNPSVTSNPDLMQSVLTFFENIHTKNIDSILNILSSNRM